MINLQDLFLNQSRKEHTVVTIYLMNGFQFKGIVRGFDSYTVVLESEDRQQLVYKHAISTIVPSKKIAISPQMMEEQ
ncbi:MAG: RNA chaperone Hfq [Eubacteriales bacterium]|nr:RNA chaperone Hfq [Eubacteriales bacterium]